MWKHLYSHAGRLVRLILRRDRIRIAIWIVAITLLTVVVAFAYTGLTPTEQERQVMAETMSNPAVTAMFGPAYGLADYTFGAIMSHQMLLFTALIVAIMSILIATRHTRADEELGRVEMVRSLPVGRLSNLCAVGLVSLVTNVLLAILVGLGLYSTGIESLDLTGSLMYGAVLGVTGLFFTGVTTLFAQLSESSRSTAGFSFSFLILAYLVRAVGDVSNETLAWFSPLGWILRAQVYVNNYWWPILLTAAGAGIVFIFALYLNSIRDLGAGLLPSRPGRESASTSLLSPVGLAFRLQRTSLIAWAIGLFVLGVSYGSIFGDLESYLEAMELIHQMLPDAEGFSLTELFMPMLVMVITVVSAIPVLLTMLRVATEEDRNRTEHLLARAVSRNRVIGSYLLIALAASIVMQFLGMVGLWSAAVAVMDDPIPFATMLKAAMAYLPALWVMIGVTVLLIGYVPRRAGLVWIYLGYSFFVLYLGGMLQLPEWLGQLTPFGHTPQIPIEKVDFAPLSILTILAVALMALGMLGYNRRDIHG